MFKRIYSYLFTGTLVIILLSNCAPSEQDTETHTFERTPTALAAGDNSAEPTPLSEPAPQKTQPAEIVPQPTFKPITYGPQRGDFPQGINPFTGLPVADPSLLEQPALLLSITHFPPDVRPQAGLSFAPWVFEYLIATGTTRFAAVFYGQFPQPEAPLTGSCEVRLDPFRQEGILLGNRVWADKNGDGVQSPEEQGVGGVCIHLYDADGNLVQQTSTDSNGYYAFNVDAGTYTVEFVKPEGFAFTEPNVGYEETDSDADQDTGRTEAIQADTDVRSWDAGLIPFVEPDPADLPPAQVGPIRSARLIHIHLVNFLQDSCLVYAGATDEIEQNIPGCATVFKKGDGGRGAMLDISRMVAISEENARKKGSNFNYANNLFTQEAPDGGKPATQVDMFFSQLNQSRWVYDPAYQGWLRYVDNASEQTEFHVDTDRLTGRQVFFDNLIVLFVEHELIQPLIIEMHLEQGEKGTGFAFRDGQMYDLKWSTTSEEYEKKTGLRRPIAFQDKDGNPFPLRPGRSWIVIATPYSGYSQEKPGKWKFHIYAPPGAGEY